MRALDRRGQGLIGLLVTIIIIGYLWKADVLSKYMKPATPASLPAPVETLPDTAALNTFKMTAQQVKSAVADYQIKKESLPRDLADLHAETGVDLMKDPWGGQYYVQNGWLKCTGNPKMAEKVW